MKEPAARLRRQWISCGSAAPRDMIDYTQEAIALLGDMSSEQMKTDRRTFLAVSRCVEIIGEAGWKLSKDLKNAHTPILWPLIEGMLSAQ